MGLADVLISYYEADWPTVFRQLALMFPNSKIGFGEIGSTSRTGKADYLTRYYTMKINEPKYVDGYFWWCGRQDFVPYTKSMWSTLNTAISTP